MSHLIYVNCISFNYTHYKETFRIQLSVLRHFNYRSSYYFSIRHETIGLLYYNSIDNLIGSKMTAPKTSSFFHVEYGIRC